MKNHGIAMVVCALAVLTNASYADGDKESVFELSALALTWYNFYDEFLLHHN
jgi:hypothetical protein